MDPKSTTNLRPNKNQRLQLNTSDDGRQPLVGFIGCSHQDQMMSNQSYTGQADTEISMPLKVLAQSPTYQENWSDGESVVVKTDNSVQGVKVIQANTAHHLMLCFEVGKQPLAQLVRDVYMQAYDHAEQLGFQHLIRVWNYLDKINETEKDPLQINEGGIERYQLFCVARHQVLESLGQLEQPNPAATAIGGHFGFNTFVFLFSRQPGIVIENKRQVSAWQYPDKYAPKQPRFSRAMSYGDLLLCSGTASVVGHETYHLNDIAAQFDECMINIQTLLDESGLTVALSHGIYRFYIRNSADAEQVSAMIKAVQIKDHVILEGDVCRENLLIECEVVFQSADKTVKLS